MGNKIGMSEEQQGFRQNRSTIDAIFRNRWLKNQENYKVIKNQSNRIS